MTLKHSVSALLVATGMSLTPAQSHAVLLGLTPELPTIQFGGSGMIDYDAATGLVTISGAPSSVFSVTPLITGDILGTGPNDVKDISIAFNVNSNGAVVPNDANVPDMVITGSLDTDGDGTTDVSGTLLTAEVTQFGFINNKVGSNDEFDLRLHVTGGELASLYTGSDLAVVVLSENSSEYATPFNGSFAANWTGQTKGSIGSASPVSGGNESCKVKVEAKCSVNGGPFEDKCRIKVSRSPKHWERGEYAHEGHSFFKSKYGMHGYPVPNWAANYPTTNVTFKYTVKNKGNAPVNDILIEDSFDTSVTGYPSSLAAGTSFSITRSIALSEGLENDVTVLGVYNGETCAASDVVTIKDKLRDRQKYDDDDFRDKGRR